MDALLAAVEAASPIAAADVLAEVLGDTFDARDVSFLIADYSGRSLIRLSHVDRRAATRANGRERGDRVPLTGTPQGRAVAEQRVQVVTEPGISRLFAPVTSRGEAVGVLELALDEPPAERTIASIAGAAHVLAYVVIANRRFTDLYEWGQRSVPLSLEAEISIACFPARTRWRRASSRSRGGWSPPGMSGATRSTSASSATPCTCR